MKQGDTDQEKADDFGEIMFHGTRFTGYVFDPRMRTGVDEISNVSVRRIEIHRLSLCFFASFTTLLVDHGGIP